jgi:hypothetical protein
MAGPFHRCCTTSLQIHVRPEAPSAGRRRKYSLEAKGQSSAEASRKTASSRVERPPVLQHQERSKGLQNVRQNNYTLPRHDVKHERHLDESEGEADTQATQPPFQCTPMGVDDDPSMSRSDSSSPSGHDHSGLYCRRFHVGLYGNIFDRIIDEDRADVFTLHAELSSVCRVKTEEPG